MTDATTNTEIPDQSAEKPVSRGRGSLILGLLFAALGGVGGYFATQAMKPGNTTPAKAPVHVEKLPDLAFVALDPMIVSLRSEAVTGHLRFHIQLEVVGQYQSDVAHLAPRIVDVVNGYLRALEPSDFQDPMILSKLRSQLLRRIQIVTGEGRVRDVLIMEFILT